MVNHHYHTSSWFLAYDNIETRSEIDCIFRQAARYEDGEIAMQKASESEAIAHSNFIVEV